MNAFISDDSKKIYFSILFFSKVKKKNSCFSKQKQKNPIKLDETQTVNFEDAVGAALSLLTCNIASPKFCDSIRFSVSITDQNFLNKTQESKLNEF